MDETFFNGHQIGSTGSFPPNYRSVSAEIRKYPVTPEFVRFTGDNVVAIRVFDGAARGGSWI